MFCERDASIRQYGPGESCLTPSCGRGGPSLLAVTYHPSRIPCKCAHIADSALLAITPKEAAGGRRSGGSGSWPRRLHGGFRCTDRGVRCPVRERPRLSQQGGWIRAWRELMLMNRSGPRPASLSRQQPRCLATARRNTGRGAGGLIVSRPRASARFAAASGGSPMIASAVSRSNNRIANQPSACFRRPILVIPSLRHYADGFNRRWRPISDPLVLAPAVRAAASLCACVGLMPCGCLFWPLLHL